MPDKTDASQPNRAAANPANYWDLRGTKKLYPTAVTSKALNEGARVSVEGFRSYLPPSTPDGFAVQDAAGAYGFARTTGATAKAVPLPNHVGRSVTILAAQGLATASAVVDGDGLVVTGTGSLIAKLA